MSNFWRVKRIDTNMYQVKGKDVFGDGGFVKCYCIGKQNAQDICDVMNMDIDNEKLTAIYKHLEILCCLKEKRVNEASGLHRLMEELRGIVNA